MLNAPDVLLPLRDIAARVRPWATAMAKERSVVLALAVGAALTHALNMFNYPSWVASSQEGTTIYRAWSLLQGRELWGDLVTRAPATTLLLGGWIGAAGGPQGFGTAIDGGRVLMLLLHVATVPLLFRLTRLLGCGVAASAFATALFAFSPLMIAQQRLVVPDNFVCFWALLGAYLLLTPLPNPPPQGGRGFWIPRFAGAGCIGLSFLSFDPPGASAMGGQIETLVTVVSEPFLALGAAALVANLALGRHDARALLVGLATAPPNAMRASERPPASPTRRARASWRPSARLATMAAAPRARKGSLTTVTSVSICPPVADGPGGADFGEELLADMAGPIPIYSLPPDAIARAAHGLAVLI